MPNSETHEGVFLVKPPLLLVVDDWEAQERYEHLLAPDFDVICVLFAKDGIEMIREGQECPQKILVDLTFEDCTPLEFVEAVTRDKFREFGLLVIIEQASPEKDKIMSHLTANDRLLERPFEWLELPQILKKL